MLHDARRGVRSTLVRNTVLLLDSHQTISPLSIGHFTHVIQKPFDRTKTAKTKTSKRYQLNGAKGLVSSPYQLTELSTVRRDPRRARHVKSVKEPCLLYLKMQCSYYYLSGKTFSLFVILPADYSDGWLGCGLLIVLGTRLSRGFISKPFCSLGDRIFSWRGSHVR